MKKKTAIFLVCFLTVLLIPAVIFFANSCENVLYDKSVSSECSIDDLEKIVADITPHLEELGLIGAGIDADNFQIILDVKADSDYDKKELLDKIQSVSDEYKNNKDKDLFVINETNLMLNYE